MGFCTFLYLFRSQVNENKFKFVFDLVMISDLFLIIVEVYIDV